MKRKTVEELQKQVWENSLHTCNYISGKGAAGEKLSCHCEIHNLDFEVSYDTIRKSTRKHHICPKCKEEDNHKDSMQLTCDYCGKIYFVAPSKAKKSDYHFCCRECKDKAQRVASGEKFDALRPDHYGDGVTAYRDTAFNAYEHKCAVCGWDEDEDILEVHHIDSNRSNSDLSNLIILCPTCHKKITLKKYYLDVENKKIIKY